MPDTDPVGSLGWRERLARYAARLRADYRHPHEALRAVYDDADCLYLAEGLAADIAAAIAGGGGLAETLLRLHAPTQECVVYCDRNPECGGTESEPCADSNDGEHTYLACGECRASGSGDFDGDEFYYRWPCPTVKAVRAAEAAPTPPPAGVQVDREALREAILSALPYKNDYASIPTGQVVEAIAAALAPLLGTPEGAAT